MAVLECNSPWYFQRIDILLDKQAIKLCRIHNSSHLSHTGWQHFQVYQSPFHRIAQCCRPMVDFHSLDLNHHPMMEFDCSNFYLLRQLSSWRFEEPQTRLVGPFQSVMGIKIFKGKCCLKLLSSLLLSLSWSSSDLLDESELWTPWDFSTNQTFHWMANQI